MRWNWWMDQLAVTFQAPWRNSSNLVTSSIVHGPLSLWNPRFGDTILLRKKPVIVYCHGVTLLLIAQFTIWARTGGRRIKRNSRAKNDRNFIISQYFSDSDGNMIAELPNKCPHHFSDDRPCKIYSDHDRERKTGPFFRSGLCGAKHMISASRYIHRPLHLMAESR